MTSIPNSLEDPYCVHKDFAEIEIFHNSGDIDEFQASITNPSSMKHKFCAIDESILTTLDTTRLGDSGAEKLAKGLDTFCIDLLEEKTFNVISRSYGLDDSVLRNFDPLASNVATLSSEHSLRYGVIPSLSQLTSISPGRKVLASTSLTSLFPNLSCLTPRSTQLSSMRSESVPLASHLSSFPGFNDIDSFSEEVTTFEANSENKSETLTDSGVIRLNNRTMYTEDSLAALFNQITVNDNIIEKPLTEPLIVKSISEDEKEAFFSPTKVFELDISDKYPTVTNAEIQPQTSPSKAYKEISEKGTLLSLSHESRISTTSTYYSDALEDIENSSMTSLCRKLSNINAGSKIRSNSCSSIYSPVLSNYDGSANNLSVCKTPFSDMFDSLERTVVKLDPPTNIARQYLSSPLVLSNQGSSLVHMNTAEEMNLQSISSSQSCSTCTAFTVHNPTNNSQSLEPSTLRNTPASKHHPSLLNVRDEQTSEKSPQPLGEINGQNKFLSLNTNSSQSCDYTEIKATSIVSATRFSRRTVTLDKPRTLVVMPTECNVFKPQQTNDATAAPSSPNDRVLHDEPVEYADKENISPKDIYKGSMTQFRNLDDPSIIRNSVDDIFNIEQKSFDKKLEKKFLFSPAEEVEINEDISKLNQHIKALEKVMDAYVDTLKEDRDHRFEVFSTLTLTAEQAQSDQQETMNQVCTVNQALADLFYRFQKAQETVRQCQKNEERLVKRVEEKRSRYIQQSQKLQKYHSHLSQKFERYVQQNDVLKSGAELKSNKLKVELHKLEIRASSLQSQFEQKNEENQELTRICEELLSSV